MKCSFCNKKSIYYRKNEGNYYCEEHFLKGIEKKVKRTISQNKLIDSNDRILIAYSGGKDSACLLYILNKIFEKNRKIELISITLDPGIKKREKELFNVTSTLTKELGINHFFIKFDDVVNKTMDKFKKEMNSGYCGTCGILKRYILNMKARELKATKLATGHNMDDESQSTIMNLIGGNMLRLSRMGPMPSSSKDKKFVPRIKPLIEIPEEELKLYCKLQKIKFIKKRCPYAHDDVLRSETKKYLNRLENKSPGVKSGILKSNYKLKPFLEKGIEKRKMKRCKICGEPSSKDICKTCQVLKLGTSQA